MSENLLLLIGTLVFRECFTAMGAKLNRAKFNLGRLAWVCFWPGLIAVLLWSFTPRFVNGTRRPEMNSIKNNLRIIDGAKDQFALEKRKKPGDPVTAEDLRDYIKGGGVKTVAREKYLVNPVGHPAEAILAKKILNFEKGSRIRADD
jgi:hypothetical protein